MTRNSQRIVCIVGAPRSGTTSLSAFLQEHPDICFSMVKEPHYFSQFDLSAEADSVLTQRIEDEYLARFFPPAAPDEPTLAEGSVSYLYAPDQMEPILRYWPDARFVIAVRDPIDLLPSLHQRLLYLGDEVVVDFEQAWRLASSRATGNNIPGSCIDPRCLQYEELGRLGEYVDRFIKAVGRERCFISVFDDLATDPAALYRRLLSFLELPYHPRLDFAPRRSSQGYRVAWLQRLLKRPPKAVRDMMAGEKFRTRIRALSTSDPMLLRMVSSGRARLLQWNRKQGEPRSLTISMQQEIRERLRDDVAQLSAVIGRDLRHWLGGERPKPSESGDLGERRYSRPETSGFVLADSGFDPIIGKA